MASRQNRPDLRLGLRLLSRFLDASAGADAAGDQMKREKSDECARVAHDTDLRPE